MEIYKLTNELFNKFTKKSFKVNYLLIYSLNRLMVNCQNNAFSKIRRSARTEAMPAASK